MALHKLECPRVHGFGPCTCHPSLPKFPGVYTQLEAPPPLEDVRAAYINPEEARRQAALDPWRAEARELRRGQTAEMGGELLQATEDRPVPQVVAWVFGEVFWRDGGAVIDRIEWLVASSTLPAAVLLTAADTSSVYARRLRVWFPAGAQVHAATTRELHGITWKDYTVSELAGRQIWTGVNAGYSTVEVLGQAPPTGIY